MEEAFVAHLLASPAAALVSNRIHWLQRPQASAVPAVTLTRVSGVHNYHHGGDSGLMESRVQVDAWAKTFAGAKEVSRAIVAHLTGATFEQGGIRFQGAFVDGERDTFEADVNPPLYRTTVDFMLWHT
ncbi:MAG: DUF3168 domain-containing protein [Beijerinckiaceae bacterium]|nr:DUF3168 domain-containing protein [Beijerinckiaceae bacterium]